MDYRERKYYLIHVPIKSCNKMNRIINILKRIPAYDRKIHLRKYERGNKYLEIILSYRPTSEQIFKEVQLYLLLNFTLFFTQITKENEQQYCHKIMKI